MDSSSDKPKTKDELRIAELEAEIERLRRYRNWYIAGELRLRRLKR